MPANPYLPPQVQQSITMGELQAKHLGLQSQFLGKRLSSGEVNSTAKASVEPEAKPQAQAQPKPQAQPSTPPVLSPDDLARHYHALHALSQTPQYARVPLAARAPIHQTMQKLRSSLPRDLLTKHAKNGKLTTPEPPPDPLKPTGQDINRGSSDIPLTPEGKKQVEHVGQLYARRHGPDGIMMSDLTRSIQTGHAISQATGAPILDTSPDLQPWHLGGLEGRRVKEVLPEMIRLQSSAPDEVPQGMGPYSTQPGESYNQYKHRFLNYMQGVMAAHDKSPHSRLVVVNHYRGIKTMQAWLKAGMPQDLSVDIPELLRHDGEPGDAHRLYRDPAENGKWKFDDKFKLDKDSGPLPPGVYINRHGKTAWNAESKVGAKGGRDQDVGSGN